MHCNQYQRYTDMCSSLTAHFCATSSNEIALRFCLVAILRPSRCHTRPSRGPLAALPEVALDRKKQYKSAPFSFHYFKVFQSRSDDRFLPKCHFCTTSSIQIFGGRFRSMTSIVLTPWNRRLTSGTNSSHRSSKGFEVLLELY